MKTIKVHFIDTPGHGYYAVSKKDIEFLGIKDKISGYSGHTLNKVYLEEDNDGTLLDKTCKEKDILQVVKRSYRENFNITHNYLPIHFNYKPKINDNIIIRNGETVKITGIDNKNIYLQRQDFKFYRIPKVKIFQYLRQIL